MVVNEIAMLPVANDRAVEVDATTIVDSDLTTERLTELNARMLADSCFRGLRSKDCLTKDGCYVHAAAFDAPKDSARERRDRGRSSADEVSIYWNDDDAAIDALKKDKRNAGHGIARLAHRHLMAVDQADGVESGDVTAERDATSENSYHGNILFRDGLSPGQKRQAQNYLALMSSVVWRPGAK